MKRETQLSVTIVAIWSVLCTSVSAWGTHVYNCLASEQWGFLIAGAIAFPIAIAHGIGIWFNVW